MSQTNPSGAATIERLIPAHLDDSDATGLETYQLHIERYDFAARFVGDGPVLDCACGVGYGSERLLRCGSGSQPVTGVDVDPSAIAYAETHYRDPRVTFICADGSTFSGGPFATIVSLETIEHVPDPEALIDNFARLLRPGGTLVASVPVTPSVDVNPYHLHDFTPSSYRRMFQKRGFTEIESLKQRQPYQPLKMLAGKETRLSDMRTNLLGYYARHPAAAVARLRSTVVDGFCNKYLTSAWTR